LNGFYQCDCSFCELPAPPFLLIGVPSGLYLYEWCAICVAGHASSIRCTAYH
jgi:hypothetical protein